MSCTRCPCTLFRKRRTYLKPIRNCPLQRMLFDFHMWCTRCPCTGSSSTEIHTDNCIRQWFCLRLPRTMNGLSTSRCTWPRSPARTNHRSSTSTRRWHRTGRVNSMWHTWRLHTRRICSGNAKTPTGSCCFGPRTSERWNMCRTPTPYIVQHTRSSSNTHTHLLSCLLGYH